SVGGAGFAAVIALLFTAGCRTIGDEDIELGAELPEGWSPSIAAVSSGGGTPEWRGPGRNGVLSNLELPASRGPFAWMDRWRIRVGAGIAGVVCSGGQVYCHTWEKERGDVVRCVRAENGDPIWERVLESEPWHQPFEASHIALGPLSTPALADDRIYVVSVQGVVTCLNSQSGEVVFQKGSRDLDSATSKFRYGHAASPLVRDGKLYVSFSTGKGHFVALDAKTGDLLWRSVGETVTYASPAYATLDGQKQVIVRSWGFLRGLHPDDGSVLWEHAARGSGFTRDCGTPIIVGNLIYITSEAHGTVALRISRDGETWKAERVFRSGGLAGTTASPVFFEGHLYGLHRHGKFVCIDALTGKRKWIVREFGEHLSLFRVGGQAFALDETGRFVWLELDPARYRPKQRWSLGKYTWAQPAFEGAFVFVRDGEDLVCRDWRAD
ncbi:MAG: PQQ-binding-like beta-propeller repeat protein, partial [Planctomycetota bacterium]